MAELRILCAVYQHKIFKTHAWLPGTLGPLDFVHPLADLGFILEGVTLGTRASEASEH